MFLCFRGSWMMMTMPCWSRLPTLSNDKWAEAVSLLTGTLGVSCSASTRWWTDAATGSGCTNACSMSMCNKRDNSIVISVSRTPWSTVSVVPSIPCWTKNTLTTAIGSISPWGPSEKTMPTKHTEPPLGNGAPRLRE